MEDEFNDMKTKPSTAELRGDCPRKIIDVLDAVSMARDQTRIALVNEILGAWAKKVLHESSLVHKIAGINPVSTESGGGTEQ